MSEESTTPDLVELARRGFEALNRRDFDAVASSYAPDAVLKLMGMGASFAGVAAIREFFEDFVGTFEEWEIELKEILDLGNGVTFGVYLQQGRPVWKQWSRSNARGNRLGVGRKRGRAAHDVHRYRRGPCCRRTTCRGEGVGDVAGEVMTPWASPATDEMAETWPIILRR
jgi:hypothetical protein